MTGQTTFEWRQIAPTMIVQTYLNGTHPALLLTAATMAADMVACVTAGVAELHS